MFEFLKFKKKTSKGSLHKTKFLLKMPKERAPNASPSKKTGYLIGISVIILPILCGYLYYFLSHSAAFNVSEVLVEGLENESFVSVDEIKRLAEEKSLGLNIFKVHLNALEKEILQNTWIRQVVLKKSFPKTLRVQIFLREPVLFVQQGEHKFSLMDEHGALFGGALKVFKWDLPIVSDISGGSLWLENSEFTKFFLVWLGRWKSAGGGEIAAIELNKDGGKILIKYELLDKKHVFPVVYFSEKPPEFFGRSSSCVQLQQVVKYLTKESIVSRQILVTGDKKIVVKTDRGS